MIPKMVKTLGVKTPAKVPRVPVGAGISRWLRAAFERELFSICQRDKTSRKLASMLLIRPAGSLLVLSDRKLLMLYLVRA
jgi:hypothetical protein